MIRFEKVTKIYPKTEQPALNQVDLNVEKGEFVFLVGLSGSGKSTFLRLVRREEKPTSGTIHVAGKDLATLPNSKVPELRRQVGTVFQDFRLLNNKTVFENVAFTLHVLGYSKKEIAREVPEVLELVGLADSLTRAIVAKPVNAGRTRGTYSLCRPLNTEAIALHYGAESWRI